MEKQRRKKIVKKSRPRRSMGTIVEFETSSKNQSSISTF